MRLRERIGIWEGHLTSGGNKEAAMVLEAIGKLRGTEDDSLLISFLIWASRQAAGFNHEFYEHAENLERLRWYRWRQAMDSCAVGA